jgi:hypothetical protein
MKAARNPAASPAIERNIRTQSSNAGTSARGWSVLLPLTALIGCLVSGCGGGGGSPGSNAPPPPPVNASPGGIWKGTTSQGQPLVGIVTESGDFHFLQEDGVQYFCGIVTQGTAVSASFTGITQVGTKFASGATYGSGSLTGTVTERSKMTGSISFAVAAAAPAVQKSFVTGVDATSPAPCGSSKASAPASKTLLDPVAGGAKLLDQPSSASTQAPAIVGGTFTLEYDALYDRDSSLATIAGNFKQANGTVVSIDAAGNVFSQDATSGCVVNGKVSVIDSRYNAYRFEYTVSSCSGELDVMNGATFGGLGTLDNTVSPEQAVIGLTYQSNSKALGLIQVLQRT